MHTLLAHAATRDEILATRTGSLASYSVTSDTGASYAVLGVVPGSDDSVYAIGRRHDNLVLVTRTGTALVRGKGEQVRIRIEFLADTGDERGTLANRINDVDVVRIGGVAPRVLFA